MSICLWNKKLKQENLSLCLDPFNNMKLSKCFLDLIWPWENRIWMNQRWRPRNDASAWLISSDRSAAFFAINPKDRLSRLLPAAEVNFSVYDFVRKRIVLILRGNPSKTKNCKWFKIDLKNGLIFFRKYFSTNLWIINLL